MKSVHWLLDEVFSQTDPTNWGIANDLAEQLISIIGNKQLEHRVINPINSFRKLAARVLADQDLNPSTIIDISGWVGDGIKPIFPQAEFVADFSLGRILDVSTTNFKRIGYITNSPLGDIRRRASELDLSRVAIIDDAGMTGRTNHLVMELFGINPSNTTHLLLLANTGSFPTPLGELIRPGAVDLLEGLGSKVIYGDTLETPQDDAEHIRDAFHHSFLEDGYSLALSLRNYTRASSNYPQQLRSFLARSGSTDILFAHPVTPEGIAQLSTEERLVKNPSYTLTEHSIGARNPLLWAFHDFWNKMDETAVYERRDEVLGILRKFKDLTEDPHLPFESRKALVIETASLDGQVIREERRL